MNVESAIKHAKLTKCNFCDQTGASIRCFRLECASTDTAFHLPCAIKSAGKFASDKVDIIIELICF
jgi:hypothetical protein